MKNFFLFAWSLVAAAVAASLSAQAAKPNVIFILVDDMGWGDLGVFYQNDRGSLPKFVTPNLDTMAAEGIQLRSHYCPAPVFAPCWAVTVRVTLSRVSTITLDVKLKPISPTGAELLTNRKPIWVPDVGMLWLAVSPPLPPDRPPATG